MAESTRYRADTQGVQAVDAEGEGHLVFLNWDVTREMVQSVSSIFIPMPKRTPAVIFCPNRSCPKSFKHPSVL